MMIQEGSHILKDGKLILSEKQVNEADEDKFRMLCNQEVTLLQRLMELGLLERSDASMILPGMAIPPTTPGESLLVSFLNISG